MKETVDRTRGIAASCGNGRCDHNDPFRVPTAEGLMTRLHVTTHPRFPQ
jgi:hypothetical protein